MLFHQRPGSGRRESHPRSLPWEGSVLSVPPHPEDWNVSGASSGGCTHVSSLEGSRSAAELWTLEDELGADPAVFPTAGTRPDLSLHSDPIFKGSAVQTIPATRPAPESPRWRPDEVLPPARIRRLRRDQQKTPRSFPGAGFRFFLVIKLAHVLSPRPGLASSVRLAYCPPRTSASNRCRSDRRVPFACLRNIIPGGMHQAELGFVDVTEVMLLSVLYR